MDSFEAISVSFYRSACSLYGHITTPPVNNPLVTSPLVTSPPVVQSPPVITSSPIITTSSLMTTNGDIPLPLPLPPQNSHTQSALPFTHHQTSPASPSSPGT